MTFLYHFHQGGHPGTGPERVRCISCVARFDRTSLARGRAVDDHRIEFSVRSIEATAAGGQSSETGAADRVGSLRTLPSETVVPTGHNWAHMTWKCPQSPQKNGGWSICHYPEGLATSVWFWGGGQTITWFFILSIPFLPWVFHRRLFKVLRKKKWNLLYLQFCIPKVTASKRKKNL